MNQITEKDIPLIELDASFPANSTLFLQNPEDKFEQREQELEWLKKNGALKVRAMGMPAFIAIMSRQMGGGKILVIWDTPWPEPLYTKYFQIIEGVLSWGHDQGKINLEHFKEQEK